MPNNIKYLIGLSIVLLHACQDNPVEEFTSGSQSLFSYNGNNNAGKSLLHQLKNHSSLQEDTRVLLNAREELLYDHAMFRSGEVYGLYYLVPVRDKASGVVNKALVYKVDAKVDQGKVRLANSLSEVLVLDEAELSRIPAYRRFLYSYPFKQWEDQGLKVLSSLSAYAKKLDGKLVPVENTELPSPISKILTSWVTITYELDLNVDIENGGVVVYGIPSSEIEAVLLQNAGVFQVYVNESIDISADYETITIFAVGGDIVSHPDLYTAIHSLMCACDADLSAEYPYYNRIIWQVTSTSADPPEEDDDDNNNTGGSTGGGSTGGGSNDNDEENEETEENDTISPILQLVNSIMTNAFKDKIFSELGVISDSVKIKEGTQSVGANASYNSETNELSVSPQMLERGYTLVDIESILYHEFVHAKQDMVDNIVIERKGKYIVTYEYEIPCDEDYVQMGWNDFYATLDVLDIPRKQEECSTLEQKRQWDMYYEMFVRTREEQFANGETYILNTNVDLIKSEIEAYRLQYEKYANVMSTTLREQTWKNLQSDEKLLYKIENYGTRIN